MLSTDFVRSYIDAWNERSPARVAEHLARGGTYHDMTELRRVTRKDFIAHLEEYFSRDNNRYVLVGEVLEGENTIAFQYLACPTDDSASDGGWMGAEFITLDGDTATRIEDYYRDPALATRERKNGGAAKGGTPDGRTPDGRTPRYAKSGLSPAAMQAVLRRLEESMVEDQAYLNSHLSLPELAASLGCSVNHLSQAINEGHGVGFFDYVNGFRVREATALLALDGPRAPTILDVALSVGFNSTSTFYAAFKRITGKTPARFRRDALAAAGNNTDTGPD
jgi:AraC-like DNA-binding protein